VTVAGSDDIRVVLRNPLWMEASEFFAMLSEKDIAAADKLDLVDEHTLVIRRWRAEQLRRLGMSWWRAYAVAPLVDWHDVANLVARGCSTELAVEIVR
jgi:hypothetical protein